MHVCMYIYRHAHLYIYTHVYIYMPKIGMFMCLSVFKKLMMQLGDHGLQSGSSFLNNPP